MLEGFDPKSIQDIEKARQRLVLLLNLIEELKLENRELREEIQRLRDDNHRLKGEQASNIPGAATPRLRRTVWAGTQITGHRAVFCREHDRAENPGILPECGNPYFQGATFQFPDQRPTAFSR